jgi:Na+-translocating ferredoxin:NAD+ oxidoreductase RnfD subunit
MQILKSIKWQLVIYLTGFAVFLAIQDRAAAFLLACILAVFLAAAIEACILYFKNRTFRFTLSSVITGLIIGYVLASDQEWWKFLAACFLAILSKHIITFKKKHIFNPAAFGILLAMVLCAAQTQWKGTYFWYILLPAGFYFSYKLGKLKIIISYSLTALLLFFLQAIARNSHPANILGYLSYFYIFIMVVEPKTSPVKAPVQIIFGAGIAVLIFILTEAGARFDVELFSLLVFNLAAVFINQLSFKQGGSK